MRTWQIRIKRSQNLVNIALREEI